MVSKNERWVKAQPLAYQMQLEARHELAPVPGVIREHATGSGYFRLALHCGKLEVDQRLCDGIDTPSTLRRAPCRNALAESRPVQTKPLK